MNIKETRVQTLVTFMPSPLVHILTSSKMSFGLIIFLIADTQLYLEEALSVRPSVGPLVRWSIGLY